MNKLTSMALILLFMVGMSFAQATPFSLTITGNDGNINLPLIIGLEPGFTEAFDGTPDELAPPLPPGDVSDIRLVGVGAGTGTDFYGDFRNNDLTQKIFRIDYKSQTGFGPFTLSWDQATAANFTSQCQIVDGINGLLFSFDMRTNSSLTITDPFIATSLRILVTGVSAPTLTADFAADVTFGAAPLTVNLTDASTAGVYPIVSYTYALGDGSTLKPGDGDTVYTYNNAGAYTVELTIVDGNGDNDIETKVDYIIVTAPPQVNFTADVTTGPAPLTVNFTDQSLASGAATLSNWSWNFGDGSPVSNAQNPTHTYAAPGFYTVSLTVTDNNGDSGSRTKTDYIKVAISTPNTFAFPFTVSDGSISQGLTIGINPDGTNGFDFGLDILAPPAPPSGNFDARILNGVDGLFTSIKDDLPTPKTFDLNYAVSTGNGPIVLTWNPANLDPDYNIEIQNLPGQPAYGPVNLNTLGGSFDVSTAGGALNIGLQLVLSPGVNVFASITSPFAFQIAQNCPATFTVQVDMTNSPSPNQALGSFTGSLIYNQSRVQVLQYSSLLSGFAENGRLIASPGRFDFAAANENGATGVVDLFTIELNMLSGLSSVLDLQFEFMAAAGTFEDLIPKLQVTDLTIDPINQSDRVVLGDVNNTRLVYPNDPNSTDALIVLTYDSFGGSAVVPGDLSRINSGVGDVNFDGLTNSTDALIILSFDVGLTVLTPVGQLVCY